MLTIAGDAIIIINHAQTITFFNQGAQDIFGYAPEEVIGKPLDLLLPERFIEIHRRHIALFSGQADASRMMSQRGRLWGRRRDGSEFPAEASITKWGTGRRQSFGVIMRDIGDQIAAQQESRRTQAILQTQMEASLDAVLVVDESGMMTSFNGRFVEMWDIPHDVIAARSDRQALAAITGKLAQPQEFLERVKYLYEHRNEKSSDEVRLKDGRILDRYSTPMFGSDGAYLGRIWYFRDVTTRQHTEKALRDTVSELREAQRVAHVGSWNLDLATDRVVWTEEIYRMLGMDPAESPPPYIEHPRFFTAESWERLSTSLSRTRENGVPYELELETVRTDGSAGWMLAIGEAIRDTDGRITGIRGTAQDITDRKQAAVALERTNRSLRMLSACNQALVRAESTPELLQSLCDLIIEVGGYRFAWIGFVERDEQKTIRPVAQHGYESGYLENAAITWLNTERGRGPTGTAARTGRTEICRNIHTDPRMMPWRADALERGYASSIALPLICDGVVVGILSIYAREPDAFGADETTLLQELAEDLSFGIATHRRNEERLRAEARADRIASFDGLTGLPNRSRMRAVIDDSIRMARARGDSLAVLLIGMDRFSEVQDAFGVKGADAQLNEVARRLGDVAGGEWTLARTADEFFALLLPDARHVRETAMNIHAAMSESFEQAGIPVDLPVTVGAALFPEHGDNADALLIRGDIAVRQARAAGTDFVIYSGRAESESPQHLALLAKLRQAIRSNQLRLYYQPKVDVSAGKICGVEALIRWPHPDGGMVPPNEFIPLAEQTGLIKALTYWVIETALEQLSRWEEAGFSIPLAINVSPNNLRDPEFLDRLGTIHTKSGARLDLLEFEITETALMEDPVRSQETLARIRAMGIKVSIDDFGTGHSSLSYIANLPIHALKIDRSFVLKMLEQPRYDAVVAASISMAKSLGLKVVAEGIETATQAMAVTRHGCNEIQGYLFSRPLPEDEFMHWYSAFDWTELRTKLLADPVQDKRAP
jgi:diguanylate cyclase (GGDEF)-like protein/PAS domain S-box-containing protein